ncbi:MAG: DUF4007 family protein [Cyanobacteriota bacterium]
MDKLLEKVSFSGHETFTFRYSWLPKAVKALADEKKPSCLFSEDNALISLGVGKNMVKSIKHWCLLTDLIEEPKGKKYSAKKYYQPTDLAKLIFLSEDKGDPYLEDPATLWLLHWNIATKSERATTWYWAFNNLNRSDFTKKILYKDLMKLAKEKDADIAENTIKRDIDCFMRMYVPSKITKSTNIEEVLDCPLVDLDLIRELDDHETYEFVKSEKSNLPIEIFAYCLMEFWENHFPHFESLNIEDIQYKANSPGKIFKLTEDSTVSRLMELSELTEQKLHFDETAGLKQIYKKDRIDYKNFLARYYNSMN